MKAAKIFVLVLAAVALAGCPTEVPDNDTQVPTIQVFLTGGSAGDRLIASTNSNANLEPATAPLATQPVGFRVVASDRGGIKNLTSYVGYNQVNNITVASTPTVQPQIIRKANEVDIVASFENPKTGEVLTFDVVNAGCSVSLAVSATDFSGNGNSIPAVDSGDPSIVVRDRTDPRCP